MKHPGHEAGRLLFDDVHGRRQFLIAMSAVPLTRFLKVVDRVKIDVWPPTNGLLEVARHGQIEDHQRPAEAQGFHRGERLARDRRLAGGGGAYDQVGGSQRLGQLVPRPRLTMPAMRQFHRPIEVPVDDRNAPDAFVLQVAQGFFGHLAGADHQRLLVVETFEDLSGEIGHRHAGDAHVPLVNGRFAGHAPGDAKGRLKHRVQQRPGVVLLRGHLIGRLDLGQDLRLAQDHAVETRRHSEQVPNRRLIAVLVELRGDLGRVQTVEASQEVGNLIERGLGLAVGGGIYFHPIAGRKQHGLDAGKRPPPAVQRLARSARRRTPSAREERPTCRDGCNRQPGLT